MLGLLPGSRASEITHIGDTFLRAARLVKDRHPALQVLLPAASAERYRQIEARLPLAADLSVRLLQGGSRDVMAAADVLLLASGTATLEAALLDAPMVVGYRMQALSWALLARLLKTPYAALPNILAGHALVPEYIQAGMTADALAEALLPLLEPDGGRDQRQGFADIRSSLQLDFDAALTGAIDRTLLQHA